MVLIVMVIIMRQKMKTWGMDRRPIVVVRTTSTEVAIVNVTVMHAGVVMAPQAVQLTADLKTFSALFRQP